MFELGHIFKKIACDIMDNLNNLMIDKIYYVRDKKNYFKGEK